MFILLTIVLFALFVTNIVLGAFASAPFLGDVGEMLILLCSSLAFVVVILQREAEEKAKSAKSQNDAHES